MVKSIEEGSRIYNRWIDVLLLCTANQCRSPMAEALLRHRLAEHGLSVSVSSAGLYPSGSPATDEAISVMAERGLDIDPHRSRQLDAGLLAEADLVIGMTREHVREVAVIDGGALGRTFTLKELVRSGLDAGPRRPDESVPAWLARAGAGRRREALLGVGYDPDFDVEDPVGRPLADHEVTAAELEDLVDRLVALVWPAKVDDGARERSA